jgi:flagellar biogenesis protein FliO
MDIQGISTSQILTVGIFLVGLIFLQVFITKNKNKFSSKWRSNKRIHLIEEKSLSTTEKIRIISIDNSEYLLISNKGKKSSFIPLDKNSSKNQNRVLPNSNYNHDSKVKTSLNLKVAGSKANEPSKGHELSKAIKQARQMNPGVSYK